MTKECITCRRYFDEKEIIDDKISPMLSLGSGKSPRCRACVKKVKKIRAIFFIVFFLFLIFGGKGTNLILVGIMIGIYLVLFHKGLI